MSTFHPLVSATERADANTTAFFVLTSVVDMGLMSKYLSTLPGEDNSLEEANEIIACLPNVLAFMRLDSHGAKRLAVTDFVAMVVNTVFGSKLLEKDLAEL